MNSNKVKIWSTLAASQITPELHKSVCFVELRRTKNAENISPFNLDISWVLEGGQKSIEVIFDVTLTRIILLN